MSDYDLGDGVKPGTNRASKPTRCTTCDGDKFVVVRLRSPEQTMLMKEKGITPSRDSFHEEMAPCPSCNPTVIEYWHHDGTRFRSMDAAAAREALQ